MRKRKDNVFYYESGEIADPLEKNTVHGLVKTLQDTKPSVTRNLLEFSIGESIPESASYDYRTEVAASGVLSDTEEKRTLIGLSRTGGVKDGGGAGDSPQVDARIKVNTPDGATRSVFIEAKVSGSDLQRGQLEEYVKAFGIGSETRSDRSWETIQWSDIYRIFENHQTLSSDSGKPLRDNYLLDEFNRRLLQKGMVRGTLGVSKSGGEREDKHRKRLLVGPKDPGGEPVLTFWAFSRRESQDQSSSMEVPQDCLQEIFDGMDIKTRRKVFIEGNLIALQRWIIQTTDLTESDFEGDGRTFAKVEREGYDEPAGIMLRFSHSDRFKINSYNVEKANGWIYHPPILVPHEWKAVFSELSEVLTQEQQKRFLENFDLNVLWNAYLNS